jgi:hypothetical protein
MWWVEAGGTRITMYTVVYVALSFLQLLIQLIALWYVCPTMGSAHVNSQKGQHWYGLRLPRRQSCIGCFFGRL